MTIFNQSGCIISPKSSYALHLTFVFDIGSWIEKKLIASNIDTYFYFLVNSQADLVITRAVVSLGDTSFVLCAQMKTLIT